MRYVPCVVRDTSLRPAPNPTRPLRMLAPAIPRTVIRSLRHPTRSMAFAQPIAVRLIGRIATRSPMRKPQFTYRVADRTSLFTTAAPAARSTPSSPPSPTPSDKARPSPSQPSGRSPRGAGPSARAAIRERGSTSPSPRRGRPPSRPGRPCATRCGDATRSTCAARNTPERPSARFRSDCPAPGSVAPPGTANLLGNATPVETTSRAARTGPWRVPSGLSQGGDVGNSSNRSHVRTHAQSCAELESPRARGAGISVPEEFPVLRRRS